MKILDLTIHTVHMFREGKDLHPKCSGCPWEGEVTPVKEANEQAIQHLRDTRRDDGRTLLDAGGPDCIVWHRWVQGRPYIFNYYPKTGEMHAWDHTDDRKPRKVR